MVVNIANALARAQAPPLERRALHEASLEAMPSPAMRQGMLAYLAAGAAGQGDLEGARTWLKRMDPRSTNLLADSQYRMSETLIATAEQRYDAVLEVLGARPTDVPIHYVESSRAAMYRANALEKTGNLDGAVEELLRHAREDKTGLCTLHSIASNNPALEPCARSLPIVTEREIDRLCREHSSPGAGFAVLSIGLLVVAVVAAGNQAGWPIIVVTAIAAVIALGLWGRAATRRHPLASGCVAVKGRVTAARAVSAGVELEVDLVPLGSEPTHVTTVQPRIPLGPEGIVDRTFTGFWSPERPIQFVQMVFNVTPKEDRS